MFLNRIAAHFGLGPTRVGGGLGASFATILQINVNYAYAAFADGSRAMRADGNATLAGGELANLHMDFWSDGFISYSGRLGYSYPSFENPTFSLFGQTDYWIEPVPGADHARFQGDGDLAVLIRGVRIASMHGFINNDWAAGCALGMRGTHNYHTGYDTMMIAFPTCDISDVAIEPTRSHEGILPPEASSAQAAPAAGARPHRPPRPARARAPGRGRRRCAEAHARRPEAPHLHADLDAEQGRAGRQLRQRLPAGRQRHAAARPAPARRHVDADAGRRARRAIKDVRSAQALPALHVSAHVKGRGRSRVLTWNARGLAGRTIRFTERAKDVGQTIVVTKKQRGRARYAIEDGSAGPRKIEAQVTTADGVPVTTPVVARYRAPGPPRPHRPGRLKTRRRHGTVTVRWARVRGADGYAVRVTGSDGRREVHFLSRKQRRLRILDRRPGDAAEAAGRGLARHPLDRGPGAHGDGPAAEGDEAAQEAQALSTPRPGDRGRRAGSASAP